MKAAALAERVAAEAKGRERLLVAIVGPPGAGKSTVAEALRGLLAARLPGKCELMPMDGFHLDNAVIEPRGLLPRKGAPETFDAEGLLSALVRIKAGTHDVAVPVFDRTADLARAGARIISRDLQIVLVEGNYLLLDDGRWRPVGDLFDLTIYLEVDDAELERRLVQRWLDHGLGEDAARERALSNDIPNARLIQTRSRPASIRVGDVELD